jgi:hypothetical protein
MVQSIARMNRHPIPQTLVDEYLRHYTRILQRIESVTNSELHLSDDLLAKDLGLCTQRLFAAGYAVVETKWSMARRHAFLGGAGQLARFGGLYYLRWRGRGPFLSNHFHPECSEQFTPEGRIHMLKVVAAIMQWRPEFKALIGSAWFYDPVIARISPNLAYVRNYLEENGASFFRGPVDNSGNAFVSSKRRKMWERGEYQPRRYLMVWPRKSLLAWSRREGSLNA